MKPARALHLASSESDVIFLGFALSDCVVELEKDVAKYLRAVHRTALELAIPNRFGIEVGGFWLMPEQLEQLRKLPECYSQLEAPFVARAIEAYLAAQLPKALLDA
ncbi:MAG TPA: hypothetical protein VHR36_03990 [Pyrinomonadaceae bacterium]|nr:hypothetical protein [Pyrinomonadaceae bacterium]